MRNFFIFLFILILFDFILSQLFFIDILYHKKITTYKNDIENRIPNREFAYGFRKNAKFLARYNNEFKVIDYLIHTNDLGFRDSSVRELNREKKYSIVMGDSFVEGTGLAYEDTLVASLNKKLGSEKFKKFEFLNAGVSSYSPYLYKKKIQSIINNNKWLKVNSVIVLYDKSDVGDELKYLKKPESFPVIKKKYKNPKKEKLLKDIKNFKIDSILTEQTMIGIFFREVLGDFFEKLIQNIKFRIKLSGKSKLNLFSISKAEINTLYATHQYSWLQKYFYDPLWKNDGKKSVDFAFENFNELKDFLNQKNINLYIVIYPWPFDLLDEKIREKYLNYVNKKLLENDLKNINVYDEFIKGNIAQNIYKYYIPKDVHFKKEGNLILSNKVYERLLQDNLIQKF